VIKNKKNPLVSDAEILLKSLQRRKPAV